MALQKRVLREGRLLLLQEDGDVVRARTEGGEGHDAHVEARKAESKRRRLGARYFRKLRKATARKGKSWRNQNA